MPATLKNRFPQIIVQIQPRTEAAMRAGAELVAERARARAPVGQGPDDPHPGRLRDSIHVERFGESAKSEDPMYRVVADAQADKKQGVRSSGRGVPTAGAEGAYYGVFLEFGAYGGRVHHPFMIPAFEESKDEIVGAEITVLRTL